MGISKYPLAKPGDIGGGISFAGSNGDCIQDIGGPFENSSATLGEGLQGSGDVFGGPGSHGQPVTGGGFTLGIGAGADAEMGGSVTNVNPLFKF